jgi:hypothetical protein
MRADGLALMAVDGAVLSGATTRAISLRRLFDCLSESAILSPRHEDNAAKTAFKDNGQFTAF